MAGQNSSQHDAVATKRGLGFYLKILVGIALLIGAIFGIITYMDQRRADTLNAAIFEAQTQLAPLVYAPSGALRMTSFEIYRQYQSNAGQAQSIFDRSQIEVSGTVIVDAMSSSGLLVRMPSGNPSMPVVFGIVSEDTSRATQLTNGQAITILCADAQYTDASGPTLSGCRFLGVAGG